MTNLTLYQIASEYRQAADILAELDLDEVTLADTLESINGDLTVKGQNIAFLVRNLEATAAQITEATAQMNRRAEALEKRAERIREYLLHNMMLAGVQKIESPYFKIAVRENPPKVIVDNEAQIPREYFTDPVPPPPPEPKLDKKLVAKALKDGFDVPGCHAERGNRLEIK
jgi:hypothetical protein